MVSPFLSPPPLPIYHSTFTEGGPQGAAGADIFPRAALSTQGSRSIADSRDRILSPGSPHHAPRPPLCCLSLPLPAVSHGPLWEKPCQVLWGRGVGRAENPLCQDENLPAYVAGSYRNKVEEQSPCLPSLPRLRPCIWEPQAMETLMNDQPRTLVQSISQCQPSRCCMEEAVSRPSWIVN